MNAALDVTLGGGDSQISSGHPENMQYGYNHASVGLSVGDTEPMELLASGTLDHSGSKAVTLPRIKGQTSNRQRSSKTAKVGFAMLSFLLCLGIALGAAKLRGVKRAEDISKDLAPRTVDVFCPPRVHLKDPVASSFYSAIVERVSHSTVQQILAQVVGMGENGILGYVSKDDVAQRSWVSALRNDASRELDADIDRNNPDSIFTRLLATVLLLESQTAERVFLFRKEIGTTNLHDSTLLGPRPEYKSARMRFHNAIITGNIEILSWSEQVKVNVQFTPEQLKFWESVYKVSSDKVCLIPMVEFDRWLYSRACRSANPDDMQTRLVLLRMGNDYLVEDIDLAKAMVLGEEAGVPLWAYLVFTIPPIGDTVGNMDR